jgi:hypothetical protein
MILRRVIHHVRKQEWTAICIDLVIVVVGVFIGIQVANWNEARLEAQRARGFLERLAGDLEREQAAIDKRLAYIGQSIAYGEAALTWVEDGTLAEGSAWTTVMAYFNASRILPYSPVNTTYQEMRSAGQLGLVHDASLRTSLTEYFDNSTHARADYILALNPEYRSHVRGLTPFRVARYISSECFDVNTVAHKPCKPPIDEVAAMAILRRYAETPELTVELAYWVDSAHLMIGLLHGQREKCLDLQKRIRIKLGALPNGESP